MQVYRFPGFQKKSISIPLWFIAELSDNVLGELFKIPEVREVAEVTGRFDVLVTMTARSLDEMHQIISEKVGRIEGIQKTETFIEMRKTSREVISNSLHK